MSTPTNSVDDLPPDDGYAGEPSDIIAVRLPAPDGGDIFDQPKWWDTGWDIGVPLPPVHGTPQVRIETSGYLEADQARLLAVALLAAANAVDASESTE